MKLLRATALYLCAIALHAGAQEPKPASEAKADWFTLHRAGIAAFDSDRHAEALANFETSLPLAQTREQNAITLVEIGYCLGELRRDAEAVEQLEKALTAWRSIDATGSWAAETAARLANEQRRVSQYVQAERTLRLALGAKPRDDASAAALLNVLGNLITDQARYAEARQAFETALRLSPGQSRNRLFALIGLGDVERLTRQWQPAVTHLNEALAVSRSVENGGWEPVALRGLGVTYSEMGDTARAEPLLRRALARFEATPALSTQYAETLVALGTVYAQDRKPALAEEAFNRALKTSQGIAADDSVTAQTLQLLAALLVRENRFPEAVEYAKRAFQIAQATLGEVGPSVASALGGIAFVEAKSGDFHDAEKHFGEALRMLREIGLDNSDVSCLLMTQYASVLRKLHKRAEAKDLEAQAKAFRSATPAPR